MSEEETTTIEQKDSIKITRNAKKDFQFEFRIAKEKDESLDDWFARVKLVKQKTLEALGEA